MRGTEGEGGGAGRERQREIEREREAKRQVEREAGSMQGAPWRTPSQDSRIMP